MTIPLYSGNNPFNTFFSRRTLLLFINLLLSLSCLFSKSCIKDGEKFKQKHIQSLKTLLDMRDDIVSLIEKHKYPKDWMKISGENGPFPGMECANRHLDILSSLLDSKLLDAEYVLSMLGYKKSYSNMSIINTIVGNMSGNCNMVFKGMCDFLGRIIKDRPDLHTQVSKLPNKKEQERHEIYDEISHEFL